MSSPKSLSGKVALVTGGSKGIGRALSLRLASDGAKVVVNYSSDSSSAEETVKAIGSSHAIAIKADAGNVKEIGKLVDEAVKAFGKLDIVIACAGIMPLKELEGLSEEEFDRVMSVNVKGPLFLTQKAIPHMKEGGRIILFSTTLCAASTVTPNYLAYCTSKGAIEQMTRLLSKDLARKGIMVNAIAPGPTATDLFMKGKSEQVLKMIAGFNPQGRIGTPEEVADVAAFLAGEGGKWITGQVVRVNGGMA
ncbi:related to 3-oxoacyl-[acyl-carrier-protein] reductase [Phialocephala subalpina]|uniref:Related to 3-oxoacyl-[acyl-carrier-protein] reductase n=1 Tax=Phialocephala subalpina TaxID=576137 RepID=A0A1L7WRR7_9HELO|nr:related to 3-oxoacyl-[acyl-carrier-protein] reductase [Phialocephala subalpina]